MEETGFTVTPEILAHMESMGLRLTFSYHCNRCDYQWFPKDFDIIGESRKMIDIFNIQAPKACARCKSKQWTKLRKRKRVFKYPIPDNVKNDGMLTVPRIKAAYRNTKRLEAYMRKIVPNFDEEYQKRFGKHGEKPKPVITIQTRKKRKLKL
jgi:hypothetical protein